MSWGRGGLFQNCTLTALINFFRPKRLYVMWKGWLIVTNLQRIITWLQLESTLQHILAPLSSLFWFSGFSHLVHSHRSHQRYRIQWQFTQIWQRVIFVNVTYCTVNCQHQMVDRKSWRLAGEQNQELVETQNRAKRRANNGLTCS